MTRSYLSRATNNQTDLPNRRQQTCTPTSWLQGGALQPTNWGICPALVVVAASTDAGCRAPRTGRVGSLPQCGQGGGESNQLVAPLHSSRRLVARSPWMANGDVDVARSPWMENGDVDMARSPWMAEGPFSENEEPNFFSSTGEEWRMSLGEGFTASLYFSPGVASFTTQKVHDGWQNGLQMNRA